MLLVDKLRPKNLTDLKGNEYNTAILQKLAVSSDLPHLLFYGPEGCGKMTRIRVLLATLFDDGIFKMKNEEKALQTPSGRRIEFSLHTSAHHLEISPSEAGIYDRIVIQETIKELAQYQRVIDSDHVYENEKVHVANGTSNKASLTANHQLHQGYRFKVAVIMDAGKLSKDAQHGLRRTMEKYSSNVRFILCTESVGSVVAPLRSRCLLLRIASPRVSVEELLGKKRSGTGPITPIPGGNLRAALLRAEFQNETNIDDKGGAITPESWESVIEEAINRCCQSGNSSNSGGDRTNSAPLIMREAFYKLLTHAIPVDYIFRTTMKTFINNARDPSIQRKVLEFAALYVP